MKTAKEISDIIYESLGYAYCDNCRNAWDENNCDDCHRKYQNWAISREHCDHLAEKIVMEKCENHITPEQFKKKMKELDEQYDEWKHPEVCHDYPGAKHQEMDRLMLIVLRQQGFGAGVDVFEHASSIDYGNVSSASEWGYQ